MTIFVLAGNTPLRPLVNAINRAPISEATEATYELRATTNHLEETRDLLETKLDNVSYPVREVEV